MTLVHGVMGRDAFGFSPVLATTSYAGENSTEQYSSMRVKRLPR